VTSPSRLHDDHRVLVLDASVTINLLGTGHAATLLHALRRTVLMDEHAVDEVIYDPSTMAPAKKAIDQLITAGLIAKTKLDKHAYETFLELTGALPPDDLDDGEAATIATAIQAHATPVIDERKARRIIAARALSVSVLHSIDLLASHVIAAALSPHDLSAAVYGALHHARMRVPEECKAWVLSVAGAERAQACPSIRTR
jgi:predicted nucleic acid-binding protein